MSDDSALESLLHAAEKRARGNFPVPDHLRGSTAAVQQQQHHNHDDDSDVATKRSPTTRDPPPPLQQHPSTALSNPFETEAEAFCRQRVPSYESWSNHLAKTQERALETRERIGALSTHVEKLLDVTTKIRQQSDSLSTNASALMARKAMLEKLLSTVTVSLEHFHKVDELFQEVSHPTLSASTARFATLLESIEDAAEFFAANAHYNSAKSYSNKLSMAYQRAMYCLRDAIVESVQSTASDILASPTYVALFSDPLKAPFVGVAAMQGKGSGSSSIQRPVTLSAALAIANDEFQQKMEKHAPLLRMLEARCGAKEAETFLNDVMTSYAEQRARLVSPLLKDYSPTADVTLSASELPPEGSPGSALAPMRSRVHHMVSNLVDAAIEERTLFDNLFLSDEMPDSAFKTIVNELSDAAYASFRSHLLTLDALEELALVGDCLLRGFTNDKLRDRGEAALLVQPTIRRMIEDTQERVIFRTSVAIRSQLNVGSVTAQQLYDSCAGVFHNNSGSEAAEGAQDDDATATSSPKPVPSIPIMAPFERCAGLLQLLFNAVEKGVFAVFADDCVHVVLTGLNKAVDRFKQFLALQRQKSPALSESEKALQFDCRQFWPILLQIRHLLFLREVLAAFDVNLTIVERSLDMHQLMQRKLELTQTARESKRDVEADLKAACEHLIQALSQSMVAALEPLKKDAVVGFIENDNTALIELLKGKLAPLGRCIFDNTLVPFIISAPTRTILWKPVRGQVLGALRGFESRARESDEALKDWQLPHSIVRLVEAL